MDQLNLHLKYQIIMVQWQEQVSEIFIQKNKFENAYGIGKGAYYIYYDGMCFNHDQQDKNAYLSFKFRTHDIIIIEVNIQSKYIKWIKQLTNESFTLLKDTSKDFYPCVNIGYKSKVEILTQLDQ